MQTAKTVVLGCAGVGSRLGLGKTKALLEINGQSLLAMHMRNFAAVEDLRIVVGFQAEAVIRETLKYRTDVVFVHNRDYFDTSAGYSLWLGARHASGLIVSWDGDLIVHPDDVQKCLDSPGEYLGYSLARTEDAVLCNVSNGMVTEFAVPKVLNSDNTRHTITPPPLFEWTGPCCLDRSRIHEEKGHVFNLLENCLPLPGMEVRAIDIDTYADYKKALELMKEWNV